MKRSRCRWPSCSFWSVTNITSSSKQAWSPWSHVGGVAAAGYLVKPTYLSILAGAVALACAMALRYPAPARLKLTFLCKLTLLICGSFVVLWAAVLLVVDGVSGFSELIKGHADFVLHTGFIGGGPGPSFSLEPMLTALRLLSVTPLPYAMIAATACFVSVAYLQWRSRALDERAGLWCVASIVPTVFATLAILSHFRAYYYVPAISCFLPFLLKPILERRGFAAVATIAVIAAGALTADEIAYTLANRKLAVDRMSVILARCELQTFVPMQVAYPPPPRRLLFILLFCAAIMRGDPRMHHIDTVHPNEASRVLRTAVEDLFGMSPPTGERLVEVQFPTSDRRDRPPAFGRHMGCGCSSARRILAERSRASDL